MSYPDCLGEPQMQSHVNLRERGRGKLDRYKRGGQVTMEVATRVMQTHDEEYWQPPEAGRGKEQVMHQRLWREHDSGDT